MTPARVPTAIWLLPDPPTRAAMQPILDRLALAWDAPRFDAHVTVHVGDREADLADDVDAALRDAALRSPPITLVARACEHSDEYFRTLYLPLAAGPRAEGSAAGAHASPEASPVHALRETLVAAQAARDRTHPSVDDAVAAYRLAPHLSLLYARLDNAARAALCERERRHLEEGAVLRFDRIALVQPAPGQVDLSQVSHWRVGAHWPLGA
ncbi:MAG: hypothetical protein AB7P21_02285 [Lautropia sp.]